LRAIRTGPYVYTSGRHQDDASCDTSSAQADTLLSYPRGR